MAMDREQRRAQILDVATGVFAEKGYHAAKIDDIVVRAGIARGTFYLYFEDKRTIFEEIVAGFMGRLGAVIRPIELLEGTHGQHMVELRANLQRVVATFRAEPAMAKILLSAAVGLDDEFDRRLLTFYDDVTELLGRALEQGEAAGLVRPGHRRIRSLCLMGLLKELLYQLVLRKTEIPSDEIVDAMMDMVADGLFTEVSRNELKA